MHDAHDRRAELFAELAQPFTGEEVFDWLPDVVFFIKNARTEYVVVNRTLVERCGRESKAELVGRRADELFPAPLGRSYRLQDEQVLPDGAAIRDRMELHFYATGRFGWCLTNKMALRGSSGAAVGLVGISKDPRAVTLLVPFPRCGATDVAARALSEPLSRFLGQRVIIENKGGGSGAVGTTEAAHAKPDGYTILLGANAITLLHLATRNLGYDTLRDFVAITQVTTQPNAIAIDPGVPAHTIQELLAYVRENPGKLSYAHPGEGSSQHLTAERLWKLALIRNEIEQWGKVARDLGIEPQ